VVKRSLDSGKSKDLVKSEITKRGREVAGVKGFFEWNRVPLPWAINELGGPHGGGGKNSLATGREGNGRGRRNVISWTRARAVRRNLAGAKVGEDPQQATLIRGEESQGTNASTAHRVAN